MGWENDLLTTLNDEGFSNNKDTATYKVENERQKLTIEEMNA